MWTCEGRHINSAGPTVRQESPGSSGEQALHHIAPHTETQWNSLTNRRFVLNKALWVSVKCHCLREILPPTLSTWVPFSPYCSPSLCCHLPQSTCHGMQFYFLLVCFCPSSPLDRLTRAGPCQFLPHDTLRTWPRAWHLVDLHKGLSDNQLKNTKRF